jgi:hypothetical protein
MCKDGVNNALSCVSTLMIMLILTVFIDAVKLETEDCGRRENVGWFNDEISAIAAAGERVLMGSAILSTLRKLPELVIRCEYRNEFCKRSTLDFKRGTRIKWGPQGRRVVKRPGTWGKKWLASSTI